MKKRKKPFGTFCFLVFKNYKVDTFSLNRMYTMIMRKKKQLIPICCYDCYWAICGQAKKNEKVKNRKAKAAFWTTNRFLFKPPLQLYSIMINHLLKYVVVVLTQLTNYIDTDAVKLSSLFNRVVLLFQFAVISFCLILLPQVCFHFPPLNQSVYAISVYAIINVLSCLVFYL